MLKKGLIQAYTTPSNEFNFAPIGLCLRAAGRGLRSVIFRFSNQGTVQAYNQATSYFPQYLHSALIDVWANRSKIRHTESGHSAALSQVRKTVVQGLYDLVVLLDVDVVLASGIVSEQDLIEICQNKGPQSELILSGKYLPKSVLSIADLVTNMDVQPIKGDLIENLPRASQAEIITGNGKGKTTYALGKAFLTSCSGLPCLMLQFIKSPMRYGEIIAASQLPHFVVKTMGKGFIYGTADHEKDKHIDAARQAWEEFKMQLASGKYRLIILDEINIATSYNLLEATEVARALRDRPPGVNLLLTGRNAHPDVVKMATTVIEMQEVKHPFHKGIKARKGIEF